MSLKLYQEFFQGSPDIHHHVCLGSYPIPTLSKLNSLLNEIGLNSYTEFSSLEAPSLSAGADTLYTSEIENIKGSKMINLDQIIDGEQLRFELKGSHIFDHNFKRNSKYPCLWNRLLHYFSLVYFESRWL